MLERIVQFTSISINNEEEGSNRSQIHKMILREQRNLINHHVNAVLEAINVEIARSEGLGLLLVEVDEVVGFDR